MKRILMLATFAGLAGTAFFFITPGDEAKPASSAAPMRSTEREQETRTAYREPSAIDPAKLGIRETNGKIDHPARIAALLKSGSDSDLQSAVAEWFEADPAAVGEWLDEQPSLAPLQGSLAGIASRIAQAGDPQRALEWAAPLEAGSLKEQTLFDIYALGRRSGAVSEDQVRNAALPPDRIEQLLSGAPGD
jgi:hypothetical protein